MREGARPHPLGLLVVRRTLGAREELVPGAVERADPVDVQRVGTLAGDEVAEWVALQDVDHLRGGERRQSDRYGSLGVTACLGGGR